MQRATMVVAIVLPCVAWTMARTGGFTGNFDNDLAWRWAPTPEDRVLAMADETPDPPRAEAVPPAAGHPRPLH